MAHRIDTDGHVANLFSDGNPATGTLGTKVDDDWCNAVQEEICNLIEGAGITLVKGTNNQLLAAIRKLDEKYATGDLTESAGSRTNVPGLAFSVVSGAVYRFEFEVWFSRSATDGIDLEITGPSSSGDAVTICPDSSSVPTHLRNGAAVGVIYVPSNPNTSSYKDVFTIRGVISASASGTVQLKAARKSGGSGSLTVYGTNYSRVTWRKL